MRTCYLLANERPGVFVVELLFVDAHGGIRVQLVPVLVAFNVAAERQQPQRRGVQRIHFRLELDVEVELRFQEPLKRPHMVSKPRSCAVVAPLP